MSDCQLNIFVCACSDKREPKRLRVDADDAHFSDVSGEVGGNEGDLEDSVAKSKRSTSPSPRGKLEEQVCSFE